MKPKVYKLLRWSEKYTKTDMIYLTHGGLWLGLGHTLNILMGLVLLIAFANLLPRESFGTYQFVIAAASIIASFTLTGLGTSMFKAVAQGSEGILRPAVKTQLTWNIGIIITSVLAALYYFIRENMLLAQAFLIVGVCQPIITGFSLAKLYLMGKEMFRESVFVDIAQKILPFLVVLTALFLFNKPLVIVLAYFTSHAISHLIVYFYIAKKFAPQYEKDQEITTYGKHLTAMNIFQDIAANLDKILIWNMLGATYVAIYTLAQIPIIHLQSIFGLMRTLIFPRVAKRNLSELKTTLPHKIRMYFGVALIVVSLYIIVAPYLFKIFFPTYIDSVVYSQVLALVVLAIPRMLYSETFAAHEMKRELYIMNLSTPLVKITFLLILLPVYGIWGAISAALITEWYSTVLQWKLFRNAKK